MYYILYRQLKSQNSYDISFSVDEVCRISDLIMEGKICFKLKRSSRYCVIIVQLYR